MSRSGNDSDRRLRSAKKRTASSARWLERQLNDPYVKQAKADGYRSRAAYKLIELDERFGLLKGVSAVIDLGIAPGGWSQVVRRRAPSARTWSLPAARSWRRSSKSGRPGILASPTAAFAKGSCAH